MFYMHKNESKSGKNRGNATNTKQASAKPSKLIIWPFYILFLVFVVLYVLTQSNYFSVYFGAAALISLIIIIVAEFVKSKNESGMKSTFAEIAIAIVAVFILWFIIRSILATATPIDVVPSCSMLPTLHRGDMIVIQGINSKNINLLKAPVINITKSDFQNMQKNMGSESLECLAYNATEGRISQTVYPGYSVGLFLFKPGTEPRIVSNDFQNGNMIKYYCGENPVKLQNGSIINEAYTTGISINGVRINGDINNSIIVYQTIPQDYFYSIGDAYIVHRLYAILNVTGNYYFLTKGDNTPGLDIQYGNYPANMSYIAGKVILDIPYLGYIRLLMSGQLEQPQGCNSTVIQQT